MSKQNQSSNSLRGNASNKLLVAVMLTSVSPLPTARQIAVTTPAAISSASSRSDFNSSAGANTGSDSAISGAQGILDIPPGMSDNPVDRMLLEIDNLRGMTDNPDEEYLAPTKQTLDILTDLLSEAARQFEAAALGDFPQGAIEDDSFGGADISWWIGKRRVILAARANGDTFLLSGLHSQRKPAVYRPVTAADLVGALTAGHDG